MCAYIILASLCGFGCMTLHDDLIFDSYEISYVCN